jgi:hypothetical protein
VINGVSFQVAVSHHLGGNCNRAEEMRKFERERSSLGTGRGYNPKTTQSQIKDQSGALLFCGFPLIPPASLISRSRNPALNAHHSQV